MKSGKQRRAELKAKRQAQMAKTRAADVDAKERQRLAILAAKKREGVAVNQENLAPYNSYGLPEFVERGYYVDTPFRCKGCGRDELWTATQQKWWYEVAKGFVYSTAKLCRACRRRERERRNEARRVHLEGAARKKRGPSS
jgi:Probable zinc-ribbon domain